MPELGDTPDEREDHLLRGGLTIQATIDPDIQAAADDAIAEEIAATDVPIASTATVQPNNGYIRALANSKEYGRDESGSTFLNYAVDSSMGGGNGIQPGSTFKAFVLAAAIRQGKGVGTRINSPQSINLAGQKFRICQNGNTVATAEPGYRPQNSTGSGTFTMKQAAERSVNTYFLQLSQRTGLCEPATIAQKAGVHRADNGGELVQVPSFTLGVNEVSPLAMAGAYGMFANRGVYCPPTSIQTITDTNGEVIVDHSEPECERVLDQDVADTVNYVLEGVIHTPGATGGRMKLEDGRRAAGKTGTTNQNKAVWFIGYTPQLSTAVAVSVVEPGLKTLEGHSFNGEVLRGSQICGGCIPGPIWKDIMDSALDGADKVRFKEPPRDTVQGDQPSRPRDSDNNDRGGNDGDDDNRRGNRRPGNGDGDADSNSGGDVRDGDSVPEQPDDTGDGDAGDGDAGDGDTGDGDETDVGGEWSD